MHRASYRKPSGNAYLHRTLLVFLSLAYLAIAGCSIVHTPYSQQKPAPRAQPKAPDPKAQQYYYDLGLQRYSEENYAKAEQAFQQAVENGPATTLGIKAQENLKKIQQILKTLEEMESK